MLLPYYPPNLLQVLQVFHSLLYLVYRTFVYVTIAYIARHDTHDEHQDIEHHHECTAVMVMNQKDRTKKPYYKERSTPDFYPEPAFISENPAMKFKKCPGGKIEFIQNVYVPKRI